MTTRQGREDARSLSLIGGAALVSIALTAVAVARAAPPAPSSSRVVVRVAEPTAAAPMSASDRLFGAVTTRSGARYEGFLRWDRNEGSWTDVLDAIKERDGRTTQTGVRFGHVRKIERLGRRDALLTLRSGERVHMSGRATDLGDGLRALRIDRPGGDGVELGWGDLAAVEFMPAPVEAHPTEARIRGVLQTRSGASFAGAVSWDVDEIYSGDILDGDLRGARQRIPFGEIAAIERDSRRGARVFLRTGEELVLEGTNDVDDSNGGIGVSDPELGEVKVSWDEFGRVDFDALDAPVPELSFDGGKAIEGTVLTESGERYEGRVRWDADESSTWEMLNGEADGISFQIEFSRISRVQRTERGARVELRDGRAFELSGSNDVDDGNRGILIDDGSRTVRVPWRDFVELRLEG